MYHILENHCISPLRIVIPEKLKSTVFTHLHELKGHLGIQNTYQLINQRYYWSGLFADVTKHVSDRVTCTTRSLNTNRPPMQATNIPRYPFEIYAMVMSVILYKQTQEIVTFLLSWTYFRHGLKPYPSYQNEVKLLQMSF